MHPPAPPRYLVLELASQDGTWSLHPQHDTSCLHSPTDGPFNTKRPTPSIMHYSVLLSILFGAISVTGLGINCRGSALCTIGIFGGSLTGVIELVGNISATDKFTPGEHIACQGHLCAFTQNYDDNYSAGDALTKLQGLA